jgi:hypothetical protein
LNHRRLRLELAPSAGLAATILAAHAAAALCLALALPPAAGSGAAGLVVLAGAASARKRALLRGHAAVRALEVGGDTLEIQLASGERFPAELAERRYVGRHLVVLCLRRPVRRTILLTRDMAGAQLFRRLRIWALWGKLPVVAAKQLPA